MGIGVVIILTIVGVMFAICAGGATVKKEATRITKTKLLTSNPHYTGRMNGRFYTETTFIIYYSDGTHKTVTVKNDTMEYKSYMDKLEA